MGLFRELLERGIHSRVQHFKACPDCRGRGKWARPLRDITGAVPIPRVMAQIQCTVCKGEGKVRVYEQWHEKGKDEHRIYYAGT